MPPKPQRRKTSKRFQVSRSEQRSMALTQSAMPDPLPMIVKDKICTITRSVSIGSYSANSTVPMTDSLKFSLSVLPNATEFTALFDAYRILQVTVLFLPYQTMCNNTTSYPGEIHSVIDYDDNSTVASPDDLRQYRTYQRYVCLEKFTRTLSPAISQAVYTTLATTGYAQGARGSKAPWIDSASPTVPWYGLKFITSNTQPTSAQLTYIVEANYVLQFRNPR